MPYRVGDCPVPQYKLEAFLGAGNYGQVWRASGPGGVPCALKIISLAKESGLKEFRSVGFVKRLQHANLVPINAVWLRDPDGNLLDDAQSDSINIRMGGTKELIIAMGLGTKSLAQRLEERAGKPADPNTGALAGGVPVKELLRYMEDAARGIDYLNAPEHDFGHGPAAVIHCDIKPANLLMIGGGTQSSVQVCDYGVVKILGGGDVRKTFSAGTPAYAPPELHNNEPSPQTDQYSLAITYFELRTGRLPFIDENKILLAILMGNLDLAALPPREQEVIRRATSIQPSKRYPSCQDMVEALRDAVGVYKISGIVQTPGERVPMAGTDEVPHLAPSAPQTLPPARPPAKPPRFSRRFTELLQPQAELLPGFKLVRRLGQGGYGEVWEALTDKGAPCALKIVRDIQGKGRHEFEILKEIVKFKHRNLLKIQSYWVLDEGGFEIPFDEVGRVGGPRATAVVMQSELADKNLRHVLDDYRRNNEPGIPTGELIRYMREAAGAIDYLNFKHNITHRDIKPENLLLYEDRLLVCDFGLAKLIDSENRVSQPNSASTSGLTAEFTAPEVLDRKKVTATTDQYSLAVTYHVLRTGKFPFPTGLSIIDQMNARVTEKLDLNSVTEAEARILRQALSANPDSRYANCAEMVECLALAVQAPVAVPQTQPGTGEHRERLPSTAELELPLGSSAISNRLTSRNATTPLPPDTKDEEEVIPLDSVHIEEPRNPSNTGTGSLEIKWGTETLGGKVIPAWMLDKEEEKTKPTWKSVAAPVATPAEKQPKAQPQFVDEEDAPRSNIGLKLVLVGGVFGVLAVIAAVTFMLVISQNGPVVTENTGTAPTSKTQPTTDEIIKKIEAALANKKPDDAEKLLAELDPLDATSAAKMRARVNAIREQLIQIRDLTEKIRKQIDKNQFVEASASIAELRSLGEEAEAKRFSDEVTAKQANMPKIVPSQKGLEQLRAARTQFALRTPDGLRKGQEILDGLLKDTTYDADSRKVAGSLQVAWKTAESTGQSLSLADKSLSAENYLAVFQPPSNEPLTPDDRTQLLTYGRQVTLTKLADAVPTLSGTANWSAISTLAEESLKGTSSDPMQTHLVRALLVEAKNELNKPSEALDPTRVTEGFPRDYTTYVEAVRQSHDSSNNVQGLAKLADSVAKSTESDPAWLNPARSRRVASLLFDTTKSLGLARTLEKPFPDKDVARVTNWLAAADKAAQKAGKGSEVDRLQIQYELFLALANHPQRDAKLFRTTGMAIAASEIPANLLPDERVRFWVYHAESCDKTPAGRTEAASDYAKALAAGRNPKTPTQAAYLLKMVIKPLDSEETVNQITGKNSAAEKKLAEVASEIGRELFHNAETWKERKLEKPLTLATRFFGRATQLGKKPEDYAWQGIALNEDKDPTAADLKVFLEDAKQDATNPVVLLLEAIVKEKSQDKELANDHFSSVDRIYQTAIKNCNQSTSLEARVLIYEYCAMNTIHWANDLGTNATQREKLLKEATRLGEWLTKNTDGRIEGLLVEGCATEDQADLLKPKTRFDANGEFARADAAFEKALVRSVNNPKIFMYRGRNFFKWTRDKFDSTVGPNKKLDYTLLTKAESQFKEAITNPLCKPEHKMESEFWLGRIATMQYQDRNSVVEKPKLHKDAVAHYSSASMIAKELKRGSWQQTIRVYLRNQILSEAKRNFLTKDLAGVSTHAGQLWEISQSANTAAERSLLQIDAIRLMTYAGQELKENWSLDLALPVDTINANENDAEIWTESLIAGSEFMLGPKLTNPAKALAYAEKAYEIAKTYPRSMLPSTRAAAYGNLGFVRFYEAIRNSEKAKELLTKETKELCEDALSRDPQNPRAWKWRVALAVQTKTEVESNRELALSDICNKLVIVTELIRNAENSIFEIDEFDDLDYSLIKEGLLKQLRPNYTSILASLKTAIGKGDSKLAPLWKLAELDLEFALSNDANRSNAWKELQKQVEAAEAAVKEIPPSQKSLQSASSNFIARVKSISAP